ncbi:hypothetical protein NONI108955_30370 [Nocardia ninae]|uniref:Uncharacterized protein n=1 Tax=Nocardia ninae NBRC 108245 TaxID=1210091 RepID=A0A511MUJ1_9NOCA|nr:hypothetical protein NN4_87920 [Nocardia ninae NBRC 108245]
MQEERQTPTSASTAHLNRGRPPTSSAVGDRCGHDQCDADADTITRTAKAKGTNISRHPRSEQAFPYGTVSGTRRLIAAGKRAGLGLEMRVAP